ncbi:MAG: transposase [Candidatus Accumulibacter sp.]|nr:transposase [Accumulibacter sp.]
MRPRKAGRKPRLDEETPQKIAARIEGPPNVSLREIIEGFSPVAFKDSSQTFKQLKEVFGIYVSTCYKCREKKRMTGFYASENEKRARRRKADPEEFKSAVKEKPDAYLRKFTEKSGCSAAAAHKCLRQLDVTHKKGSCILGKTRRRQGGISRESK